MENKVAKEEAYYPFFTFDPSRDEVLGVFGDSIHVKGIEILDDKNEEDIVLIIPRKEYIKVWNNWLDGKKRYCESWKHYCGVMGYVFPEKYRKENYQIDLTTFDETKDVDDPEFVGSKKVNVYSVTKFDDRPDFEHG